MEGGEKKEWQLTPKLETSEREMVSLRYILPELSILGFSINVEWKF